MEQVGSGVVHSAETIESADGRIQAFVIRFGQPHLNLAYHAAFPLALTPDMVYRLWANFQHDNWGDPLNVPWVAVADLLLSNLCQDIGHELYQMDLAVRDLLLNEMAAHPTLGAERIEELADFLQGYVGHELKSRSRHVRVQAEAQEWTALAYKRPDQAAEKLAAALVKLDWEKEYDRREIGRISALMQSLKRPLQQAESDVKPFLNYAAIAQKMAEGDLVGADALLKEAGFGEKITVGKVSIPVQPVAPTLDIASGIKNFDIHVGVRRKEDGRYLVRAETSDNLRTDPTWQELPVADRIFQDLLAYIRSRVARPDDAQKLGQMLYKFLFPPPVEDLFQRSLAQTHVQGGNGGWRIRLRVPRGLFELYEIPWEYCHDGANFLALSRTHPLLRFVSVDTPYEPLPLPPSLRVLRVMANPNDLPSRAFVAEEEFTNAVFAELVGTGRVELKFIQQTTSSLLRQYVREFDPHILNFVANGVRQESGEGALALEDDQGNTQLVGAEELARWLQQSSVKLVWYEGKNIPNFGPTLVRLGIPAAMPIQYAFPDNVGIPLYRTFLDLIANGIPLDEAITEARLKAHLVSDNRYFWASPALITHIPNGVIWRPRKEEEGEEMESAVPRVWFYMATGDDPYQLDLLADKDEVVWGANRHTQPGDIILMYRTAPYSNIGYIFRAQSEAREVEKTDSWSWDYAIDLADKLTLTRPIPLSEIHQHPLLTEWSLAHSPQGAMRRQKDIRQEGYWEMLRGLIIAWNPELAGSLALWENITPETLRTEALGLVADIPDEGQRVDALSQLVFDLPRAADALPIARQIMDEKVRSRALITVALPLATESGYEALALVNEVRDALMKSEAGLDSAQAWHQIINLAVEIGGEQAQPLLTLLQENEEPTVRQTIRRFLEKRQPNSRFLENITIPDDTIIITGTTFTKTWLVENNGDVAWGSGFKLVHVGGEPMTDETARPLPAAAPGAKVEISIEFTVPDTPGVHFSDWRFQDDQGTSFGDLVYTRIIAEAPSDLSDGISDSRFVADITIPDDISVKAGQMFTKAWRVRNSGTRDWGTGFTLNFVGGQQMETRLKHSLPAASPGSEVDISIDMEAPLTPGTHFSDYRMKDEAGHVFGEVLYVRIVVPGTSDALPSPIPDLAGTLVQPFSQSDPRWADNRQGTSRSSKTIREWGSLLTCLTMVANALKHDVTPPRLNDKLVRAKGFIDEHIINLSALSKAYPDIAYDGQVRATPVIFERIDASLAGGVPIPIQVDFNRGFPYTDADQHWVLIVGRLEDDYRIVDPWLWPPQEASLQERYGRYGRPLYDTIMSAIFYRAAVASEAEADTKPTEPQPQYSTETPIHFPLIEKIGVTPLFYYRPWGVRTIKIIVSTQESMPPLRLRPHRIRSEEREAGIIRGYADDSDAFIISWHGGHETGPCIKSEDSLAAFERCAPLDPGELHYAFFNLHHAGPELPATATATLEAFDESSGKVVAALPIQLALPPSTTKDIIRLEVIEPGLWKTQVGRFLPQYESRWWPDVEPTYETTETPPLSLHREGNRLLVQWVGRVVAEIEDKTRPAVLDTDGIQVELFAFDEWHLALRLWFFWLDATKVEGGFAGIGRHEVPDVERFDLLLRKSDGQVTLACTDLHWREIWGQVVEPPLRATIGLTSQDALKIGTEPLGQLWSNISRERTQNHEVIYNPIYFIRQVAAQLGRGDTVQWR